MTPIDGGIKDDLLDRKLSTCILLPIAKQPKTPAVGKALYLNISIAWRIIEKEFTVQIQVIIK